MTALLLDTNIWVDLELRTDNSDDIVKLLGQAAARNVRIGIAAHSLKDVSIIIERRLKQLERENPEMGEHQSGPAARAAAWAVVGHIMQFAEIVGSDYSDAYSATKDRVFHDYFEDNLVIAAARRMNADLLVTNDQELLRHAPIAALDAASALEWMKAFD